MVALPQGTSLFEAVYLLSPHVSTDTIGFTVALINQKNIKELASVVIVFHHALLLIAI